MLKKDPAGLLGKLIKKYLKGGANAAESAFVENYYQSFEKKADLTSSFTAVEEDETRKRIFEGINAKIDQAESTPVISMARRTWLKVAAAAAVLLFATAIIYYTLNDRKQKPVLANG